MSNSSINYQSVLDDLIARRAKLDAAIDAIRDIMGDRPSREVETVKLAHGGLFEAQVIAGPYAGKTIGAAVVEFLKAMGEPRSTTDILVGLRRGGVRSQSKNFYRTLYNTLTTNLDKELVRDEETGRWGLKEWALKK